MPHKIILRIFAISSVLATLLRSAQLLLTIDSSTGFSVGGYYEKVNIIIYAVLLLLIIIPSFFSAVLSTLQPTHAPVPQSFRLLTLTNFLVAVCIFGVAAIRIVDLETMSPLSIVEIIVLLISVVWFIFYATAGIANIKLPVALSIAPAVLCLLKLINVFVSHNGLANISENIIEILFLCSLSLFFLLQSKIICNVAICKSSRIILTVAIITFMLMLIGNLPPLFVDMMGKSELLHTSSTFNLEYVFLGTYALAFTMMLYTKSKWLPSIDTYSIEIMEATEVDPTSNTEFFMDPNENP